MKWNTWKWWVAEPKATQPTCNRTGLRCLIRFWRWLYYMLCYSRWRVHSTALIRVNITNMTSSIITSKSMAFRSEDVRSNIHQTSGKPHTQSAYTNRINNPHCKRMKHQDDVKLVLNRLKCPNKQRPRIFFYRLSLSLSISFAYSKCVKIYRPPSLCRTI